MDIRIGWEQLNPVVSFANRLACEPGFVFGPRAVREHQFIYTAAGKGRAEIGRRRYEAVQGDLFYYGPGVPHRFEADEAEPFVLYGLHFAPTGELPAAGAVLYVPPVELRRDAGASQAAESRLILGDAAGGLTVPERICLPPAFAEPFFASAAQYFRTADALHHLRGRALLMRFLTELHERIRQANAEQEPAASLLETVRTRLRERAAERYRREWLSDWTHYHANHAAALFARLYGQSPHDYFLDCKLQLAKSLLADEALSVLETAERLQFGSVHHFTRLFKRRVGCAPAAYRRIAGLV